MNKFFSIISAIGNIASIFGFLFVFTQDKHSQIIALSVFCLILLLALIAFIWFLNNYFSSKYDESLVSKTAFFTYRTLDAKTIYYEAWRNLQCKRIMTNKFEWDFKWTGNQMPKIESYTHKVINPKDMDPNEYDKAVITFDTPICYNEVVSANIHTTINDQEKASEPMLETRIKHPMEFVKFQAILLYKEKAVPDAIIYKRKTNGVGKKIHHANCKFDYETKSYDYILTNPEVGYSYSLVWER